MKIKKNFDSPYFSKSIAEFWKRWHISLSTWFRDYVYIPIGGNRVVKWRWYYNLFITFLVSGLWHGANWTYVAWGALHGFYLVFARMTSITSESIWKKIGLPSLIRNTIELTTTFSLVCVAWIFFRANNISDAFYIIQNLFTINDFATNLGALLAVQGMSVFKLAIAIGVILLLLIIDALLNQRKEWVIQFNQSWLSPVGYSAFIVLILMLGVFSDSGQFIYFQF